MYKEVFSEEQKKELILVEVELIEIAFSLNDRLGERAVRSALDNFYSYLCNALDSNFLPAMNMEYRKYVIDLISALPDKILPKAMPVILGLRGE